MKTGLLICIAGFAIATAACSDEKAGGASATATTAATYDAVTRLPIAPSASSFSRVSWDVSPDGTRVAFIGGGFDVYLAEAPEFKPELLAAGPAFEPRWSPDGELVIFGRADDGLNIVVVEDERSAAIEYDDGWRAQLVRILRWIDDDTVAYEVHCGTGCQHLFEIALNRDGTSLPIRARHVKQVPFVRSCDTCVTAGLAFHYSPDALYVVADYGGMPSVAWYERSTGEQWLVAFDDDPEGMQIFRNFAAWDADSRTFVYREAIGPPTETITPGSAWTCWRADPEERSRIQISCEGFGG